MMRALPRVPSHYIRCSGLPGFADLVAKYGGDPRVLLEAAGLSTSTLNEPDRLILWSALGALMNISSQALNRPSFGLEWSASVPHYLPNVGPTILIARVVRTFREWIVTSMRYWRYHTNAFTFCPIDDGASDVAALRFDIDAKATANRHQIEYLLGNTVRIGRFMDDYEDSMLRAVRFQHGAPIDTDLHQAFFKCPVEFDALHDEIAFDRRLLEFPTDVSPEPFKEVLDRCIRYRIKQMPIYDRTIREIVASAIRAVIGSGMCSSEFIAQSLGLTNKKMQRVLLSEGTSFSDLLDEVRQDIAMRLLVESDAPISRIAGLLDYSSVGALTLAFKRWTGETPLEFRKTRARQASA